MITNVLEYLEASVQKSPNKIAYSDEHAQLTYLQAQKAAKSVGTALAGLNAPMGAVAVLMEKSAANVAGLFGAVYSGNFYVPLDASLPKLRIQNIMQSLKPIAVLTDKENEETVNSLGLKCAVLHYEEAVNTPADEARLLAIRKNALSTDPLYAIFTSGSTGIPKGVLISHGSVIDLVEQFAETFDFSEDEVFGNQAPFDFDVSVKDIYSTIKNTATMHIIPRACFSFPVKLIAFLNQRRVTVAIWATSVMRIVANLKALEKDKPKYLKKIMFSGEVMPVKVLNYWRGHIPDALYVNLYGPTEITCNCTYYKVDREYAENQMLPIGIPFRNTAILVLNEKNEPAAVDEQGEICVRGLSLALGYYNNPEKTAEAFCQNPLNTHYPERIYRTGDIGKYGKDGLLYFVSRRDSQIKHMGHRIELGEVEVALNALPFIEAACCMYDAGKEKVVAFYQAKAECAKEIIIGLKEYLPKYMHPNILIHYEKLPMNKNAKIDRTRLKDEYTDAQG